MNNVENRGCYGKLSIKDGVPYIYTTSGLFILPQFWGLYEGTEKPEGVALKEGEHGVLIALKGSDRNLVLLKDWGKDIVGKSFDDEKEAIHDWDGAANTMLFQKAESPAAKFCMDYKTDTIEKGKWWLPSYAEMKLMTKYKNPIDACLCICGGNPLSYGWHWTSTQFSSRSAWIFYWSDGDTHYNNKNFNTRVRPVSAFPATL